MEIKIQLLKISVRKKWFELDLLRINDRSLLDVWYHEGYDYKAGAIGKDHCIIASSLFGLIKITKRIKQKHDEIKEEVNYPRTGGLSQDTGPRN